MDETQSQPSGQTDTTSDTNNTAPTQPARWEDLGLSEAALKLIKEQGFQAPTPVQAGSIPIALDGCDVIASAQTGTGKTASFVLPMVEKLAGREGTYGLILAPTREIVQQIQATIQLFGAPRGVRSITLIGGIDMKIDAAALNSYPQIIVATPGRLCDHLDRGNVWLDFIEMVVLDEADRMLDMGFTDQLTRIMTDVPENRQTLLFSATFTPTVEKLARKILYNPERVTIGKPLSAATTVEQKFLMMSEESKNRELRRIIAEEKGSIIVFTRSKDDASRVWRSLHSYGIYDATYIHSDRLQSHREQALAEFKEGKYRVLIATDIAGRGIHVDNVAHVVNYDLPREPEDYIHRIGRTGRQDATGKATSFITHRDRAIVKRIEAVLKKKIQIEGGDSRDEDSRGGPRHGGRDSRGGGQRHSRGGDRSQQAQANPAAGNEAPQPRPVPSQNPARVIQPRPAGAPPVEGQAAPADHRQQAAQEAAAVMGESGTPGEGGDQKKRRRRRGGRGRGPKGPGGQSSPGEGNPGQASGAPQGGDSQS